VRATHVDLIVVGAGLAGAAIAWAAQRRGWSVRLLDRGDPTTCSRVAAGLLTPITGPRLTIEANLATTWATAVAHYRAVEAATGRRCLTERVAVRWLRDATEAERWRRRCGSPDAQAWSVPIPAAAARLEIPAPHGCFAMRSAQLDTTAYLDATWDYFRGETGPVDWSRDVTAAADGVRLGETTARAIVACEGVLPAGHPAAEGLAFRPARGDILTVRFEAPPPDLVLHGGCWLAPAPTPGLTLVGATYDFARLDAGPCPQGRITLEMRARALLPRRYEVIDHRSAVRPILVGRAPVARWFDRAGTMGVLTGLGSKGALWAPRLAQALIAAA
jgi:glycine/D-amino acid oxidase-like deaminating enzyme